MNQYQSHEKIWKRFDATDQQLLQIESSLSRNETVNFQQTNDYVSILFKKRLRMIPKIATGQYFLLQLVHRFGLDIAEIASWCTLSPLMIFNIYRGRPGKWASDFIFKKLLRFYCVVLRHNLQRTQ